MAIIDVTRRASSALRQSERGWDWGMTLTAGGPTLAQIQVSADDAQAESMRLIANLIEMSGSSNNQGNATGAFVQASKEHHRGR